MGVIVGSLLLSLYDIIFIFLFIVDLMLNFSMNVDRTKEFLDRTVERPSVCSGKYVMYVRRLTYVWIHIFNIYDSLKVRRM